MSPPPLLGQERNFDLFQRATTVQIPTFPSPTQTGGGNEVEGTEHSSSSYVDTSSCSCELRIRKLGCLPASKVDVESPSEGEEGRTKRAKKKKERRKEPGQQRGGGGGRIDPSLLGGRKEVLMSHVLFVIKDFDHAQEKEKCSMLSSYYFHLGAVVTVPWLE